MYNGHSAGLLGQCSHVVISREGWLREYSTILKVHFVNTHMAKYVISINNDPFVESLEGGKQMRVERKS